MLTKQQLDNYKGKGIRDICTHQYVNDADNHCAHFVSHALGFSFGFTCKGMTGKGEGKGASIRVYELFARCPEVGNWDDKKAILTSCLVFITASTNVDLKKKRMTNVPRKHVGIFLNGTIWHYSNTRDHVVTQTPDQFRHHYVGPEYKLFYGTFPQ
jgi:hypothetical protein